MDTVVDVWDPFGSFKSSGHRPQMTPGPGRLTGGLLALLGLLAATTSAEGGGASVFAA